RSPPPYWPFCSSDGAGLSKVMAVMGTGCLLAYRNTCDRNKHRQTGPVLDVLP
ncbi:MAG: hypothetical protein QOH84_3815, partial [Kribbellaceae bacterium]|nr:hypothetical protein [Kribbellaceae bacterium]